jgi:hypothetical protein
MTTKPFSANSLKLIAITAMLTDHIAWVFVPFFTPAGQTMHIIGRLTAPIMCFFIAEGYRHTHSVKKYMLRLLCFALISQIPFSLAFSGKPFDFTKLNMMFTLLLGLIALWAFDNIKDNILKTIIVVACIIAASPADWGAFGVSFILVFGLFRSSFKKQAFFFCLIAAYMIISLAVRNALDNKSPFADIYQAGLFLSLPLLYLYNGKRGGFIGSKWLFYVFYPAHLLAIAIVAKNL